MKTFLTLLIFGGLAAALVMSGVIRVPGVGPASLLQDCLNANPYSAGCPLDDQHCRELEQHQIFDRNCHSTYGAQLEIKK